MIKSQRFIPLLLKSLRRPYIPLNFMNTFPSNISIKGLNFYPLASFMTQNDSKAANKSNEEEEEFTSDEEGDEANVEGWGTRVDAYHLREKSRYNTVFGRVLSRVMKTSLIYAESTAEEKANLTEDSRFYYIKRKFDELGEEQTKEYIEYLNGIPDLLMKRSKEKVKIFGIDAEEESRKLTIFAGREVYKKRFIASYLQSNPKYGKVLGDLAMEFLETENADYQSYLRVRDEEKRIGQFKPHNRSQSKKMKVMVDYKDDLKQKFEKVLSETELITSYKIYNERKKFEKREIQERKNKNSYYSVSNLVRIGFIRVCLTMGLYLTFPQRILETMPKGSRFYYVHKRLGSWSTEDKHKLWVFLDKIKQDVSIGLPEEVAENSKMKNFSSANQEEVFYLLHNKEYGKLFQELFTEFFEEDSMDKFYFLNAHEDEFIVGKFGAPSRRMKKFTKEYYGANIARIRQKFQDYLDAKTPADLIKDKEPKEPKNESEDGNKEIKKMKRGRKPKNAFGHISI